MSTLSTGYCLIQNIIGTEYAEVIFEIAKENERNSIFIPTFFDRATKLKKVLPPKVLKKLILELGGQRLNLSKRHLKVDIAEEREFISKELAQKGYSVNEIAMIIGVSEKTVLNYCNPPKAVDSYLYERQMSLF